ncbi:rhodanese-like domain-containing protein [uncultured Tateyamaria sp.]|uniref:rhodanese-like domain-containing protein n=1 Tax=uncultured Tateyamaria sp. TaxID=455651 RepID=UPI002637143F|nr:rhodanese-like domain-containing protein [uncultured Tateyamaria sp.]
MDQTPHSISAQKLMFDLGTHRIPQLVDVCVPEDIAVAPWRIPGAVHVSHQDVADWAGTANRHVPIVVICQKGLKLSHGAAALLRSMGFYATALTGGILAWLAADYPRLSLSAAPSVGTHWVLPATRDRRALSAAWVVRRWYDPTAPLLWVAPELVSEVASRFNAHALELDTPLPRAFEACGLMAAHLSAFLDHIETETSPVVTLLGALRNLHHRDEGLVHAALPLLDAAWVAFRQQIGQEAA